MQKYVIALYIRLSIEDYKRTLYEHYLMGEIDLSTYKEEKVACDKLLLKTKTPMPQYWHRRGRSKTNRHGRTAARKRPRQFLMRTR